MNRKYLIAILLLIAAILIGIVFVYPAFITRNTSASLIVKTEDELAKQQSLIVEVKRVEKKFKAIEKDVLKLSDILPPFGRESIPNLFIELEGIVTTNGLLINAISFLGESSNINDEIIAVNNYSIINVALSITGSYSAFKNFIQAIEENRHLMDIINLSITTSETLDEKEDAKDKMNYNVLVDVYYQ